MDLRPAQKKTLIYGFFLLIIIVPAVAYLLSWWLLRSDIFISYHKLSVFVNLSLLALYLWHVRKRKLLLLFLAIVPAYVFLVRHFGKSIQPLLRMRELTGDIDQDNVLYLYFLLSFLLYPVSFLLVSTGVSVNKNRALHAFLFGLFFQGFLYTVPPNVILFFQKFNFFDDLVLMPMLSGLFFLAGLLCYFILENLYERNQLWKIPLNNQFISRNNFLFSYSVLFIVLIFTLISFGSVQERPILINFSYFAKVVAVPFIVFLVLMLISVIKSRFYTISYDAHWMYLLCFMPFLNLIPLTKLLSKDASLESVSSHVVEKSRKNFILQFFIFYFIMIGFKIFFIVQNLVERSGELENVMILMGLHIGVTVAQLLFLWYATQSKMGFWALIGVSAVFYILWPFVENVSPEKSFLEFMRVTIGFIILYFSFEEKSLTIQQEDRNSVGIA